jgi:hypothetical protein
MTSNRISQLRNLAYRVAQNAWKRQTGCRSERREANENDMAIVSELCGALEEALDELEKLCSS